ncbi:MAG: hypothetical protein ACKPBU_13190, partial [Alphaproteobacteria bacterium]
MRIGIQLATLPATEILALARKADELGFSDVFVPDHWAYEKQGCELDADAHETCATLSAPASSKRRRAGLPAP